MSETKIWNLKYEKNRRASETSLGMWGVPT